MSALDAFIPDDAPSRTLFSISTGLAADLGPYSAFPGEGELLIPAGTVFEVVNVKRFSRSAARPRADAVSGRCLQERLLHAWRFRSANPDCFCGQQPHHRGAQGRREPPRHACLGSKWGGPGARGAAGSEDEEGAGGLRRRQTRLLFC